MSLRPYRAENETLFLIKCIKTVFVHRLKHIEMNSFHCIDNNLVA